MAWYDELNQGISQPTNKAGSVQELRATMQTQQPTTTKKDKNFWVDQISTAGGIGGSLGGAALGTAILPGIGTIIGGILGGALGSGGGEAIENVATGEKDIMKNVGSEALMGGIFGTPILRSGKALISGGKALVSGAGKTAANTAIKEVLGSKILGAAVKEGVGGTLKKGATTALADAWGIRPGVKVAGKLITPQTAESLQKFAVENIGVSKIGNAKELFSKTVSYLDNIGSSIDNTIKTIPTGKINVKQLATDLTSKLKSGIGTDVKNPIAHDILTRIKSATSADDLWKLRKEIDTNLISWGRSASGAIPGAEQVARTARTTISKALSSVSPEIKALNSQYSKAIKVMDLSAAATKTPKGLKVPGMLGSIGGGTTQSVKAGIGNTMNAVGNGVSSITSKIPQGLVGTAARQIGGRALVGGQPQLDQAIMQQSATSDMPWYQTPTSNTTTSSTQTSPYSKEALMYDMQRDPTNASKYIDYYNQIATIYGGTDSTNKYSSVIAGNISDYQSSLNELSNLASAISTGSGTVDPIMGRIRSANPYDVDQQTLQAMIDKTRQIVGKALEGGVLRKEDEEKYKKILPTTADTKEVAINKISMITAQLNAKMQNYASLVGAGNTTSNSLEDALMQSQNQSNYNNTGSY